jgi:hypothetical protein
MKKKIFFHKNQSDQIIFHLFNDSLFRNDNINRKYNSNIRKFEDHTKSYICFDTFENPRFGSDFKMSVRFRSLYLTTSGVIRVGLDRTSPNYSATEK